jgi:hypothetical protein
MTSSLIQWKSKVHSNINHWFTLFNKPHHGYLKDPWLLRNKAGTGMQITVNQWEPEQISQSRCIEQFWNRSADHPDQYRSLFYNFFWMMFKFSSSVNDRALMLRNIAGMANSTRPHIGVHMRTGGDKQFGSEWKADRENLLQFVNCSQKLQRGLESCLGFRPEIYVALR